MKLNLTFVLFNFVLIIMNSASAEAQVLTPLQCGDIVEGEIIAGQSEILDLPGGVQITTDQYLLDIQAGTIINLSVSPLGSAFNVAVALLDLGGNHILLMNETIEGETEQLINFTLGSSNQTLRILGALQGTTFSSGIDDRTFYYNFTGSNYAGRYFGAYEIRLGCTLRDGTVIEPGDAVNNSTNATNLDVPAFSGVGFPGLRPVDFNSAVKLPLIVSSPVAAANANASADTAQGESQINPTIPMTAAITPTGSEVIGFTIDAAANDKLDLAISRISGNLNLGVVVLSPDNKVVFYGGLITSESLSTRLTLPSAGQYTIGVFRVDLLPPDAPEATAFQVMGTLNP